MSGTRSHFAFAQSALSLFGVRQVLFERRSEPRRPAKGTLAITWKNEFSESRHARVQMLNYSDHGVAFCGKSEIPVGYVIGIRQGEGISRAVIRHSRPSESEFIMGAELCETYRVPIAAGHGEPA